MQRRHQRLINLSAAMARTSTLTAQPAQTLTAQPAQRPLMAGIDTGVERDHPDLASQLFGKGHSFIGTGAAGGARRLLDWVSVAR
jgi:hypothetical protein